MPKYIIERDIPGAGELSAAELQGIAQKSCGILKNMGPQIQWVESYVTDDKVYCTYIAPNDPNTCLLYTSPSPRDRTRSRMPSSA